MSTTRTRATALLGRGISYSLSPALHEREGTHLGISMSYTLFDTTDHDFSAEEALRFAAAADLVGANVTQPFKEDALRLVDVVDPVAAAIGAVNTIRYTGDGAVGYNTDVDGFNAELDLDIGSVDYRTVVQFGAGGAGAASAFAALQHGAQALWIIDLDQKRAVLLANRMRLAFPDRQILPRGTDAIQTAMKAATGVINASTRGSAKDPGTPVPAQFLHGDLWVADVLYAPRVSQLLHDARAQGAVTSNGGRMLVHQAAKSFEIFHDSPADAERMWQHFIQLTAA